MKVYSGADHRGTKLKSKLIRFMSGLGHDVEDIGVPEGTQMCDYPKIAKKVATKVSKQKNSRGVLVCMTGLGHLIAANKIRGAYAVLCYNVQAAALSRQHNNSNILVLGAKFVKAKDIEKIVKTWLNTKFEGGRHLRRVNQIKRIEQGK